MPSFDPNAAAAPDSGVYGLPFTPEESKVILIPVPFEATTSYGGGTSGGPEAILRASRQVDLFDLETGKPYEAGIAMLPSPKEVAEWNARARALARPIIDAGGDLDAAPGLEGKLAEVNALCERMNDWVYRTASTWLDAGKIVGVVGGDHSVPFGSIRAHAERYPGMGVLHLDAHADLREAFEGFTWSHASIFHNVMERIPEVAKLVQVGIRDVGGDELDYAAKSRGRIVDLFDTDLFRARFDGVPWNRQVRAIVRHLPKDVYLSFDIDGLDPVLCPHTGTPVPGGLAFAEATALVAGIVASGRRIVGFDLCEVAPGPEGDWDGNVGARLLYKMIGWTLKSQALKSRSRATKRTARQKRTAGRRRTAR
ncbi:MAG: agmatinase family protein [Myxococcaceae bacterium]|nr:agmatinase family protein [Myxococcaceae bacterium]